MISDLSFSSASLCVVGNLNRDIKTAPLRPDNCLFEDGENSVAWVTETIGGGGANSAAAAAALGARVSLVGKVGGDPLGRRLEEALRRHGVRPFLRKDPHSVTGTSIALSFTNGHRHFLSCLPNNESLRLEDLDLAGLDGCGHLHRADVWFSEAMLYGGNRRLFERARQAGMAISIDLNWDPKWGSAPEEEIGRCKEAIRQVLPLVNLAHGNIRELNEFSGSSDLSVTLERLVGWGVPAVVVHLGAEGAGYYARDPDGGETGPGDAGGKHHGNRRRAQRVHDASPRARGDCDHGPAAPRQHDRLRVH